MRSMVEGHAPDGEASPCRAMPRRPLALRPVPLHPRFAAVPLPVPGRIGARGNLCEGTRAQPGDRP